MGRRKDSPATVAAKQQAARLIKAALEKGRNPKADPLVPQPPIEPRDFAKAIGQDPSLGPKWCNEKTPTTPIFIPQILDGLFGDNPAFTAEREVLEIALYRANRRTPPERPRSEVGKNLSDYAHPVVLAVNQRTPDNQGNLRVPFTLRFQHDEGWKFPAKIDGKEVNLTLDIGVSRALFSVASTHWQPTADSLFRVQREQGAQVENGPFQDSLWVNGPKAGAILSGYPFTPTQAEEVEPALVRATFERVSTVPSETDGPITFRVHADPNALQVTVRGPVALSDRQQDVINAICAEPIRLDGRGRLEMAHAAEASQAKPANESR